MLAADKTRLSASKFLQANTDIILEGDAAVPYLGSRR
jgi:hypothetical protein